MDITTKRKSLKIILLEYAHERTYVSVDGTRRWLKGQGFSYTPLSVKQELNNLKKNGSLYDAGRGWYTTLSEPYPLNTEVISKQERLITRAFHLLSFSIWSNRQILSHYQHLPTRYVTFVYLESEALATVRDYLIGEGLPVYMNPHAPDVNKNFNMEKNPFVLRLRITEQPTMGHFATIEKILVDLWIEKNKLYLMDEWEYKEIFKSVVGRFRINMGALLRYSQRRKIKDIFEKLIKPLFTTNVDDDLQNKWR
jgi:hypothetical protein